MPGSGKTGHVQDVYACVTGFSTIYQLSHKAYPILWSDFISFSRPIPLLRTSTIIPSYTHEFCIQCIHSSIADLTNLSSFLELVFANPVYLPLR